jgi:hypothetical protein
MKRQTGVTITIILAVLSLCCSTMCCASGAFMTLDQGATLDTYIKPAWGIVPICLGVLIWIIPLLTWIILVRNKEVS